MNLCTFFAVWFILATIQDKRRQQQKVRTAERIIGAPLPTIQYWYTGSRVRKQAGKIITDPVDAGHNLFEFLPLAGAREH